MNVNRKRQEFYKYDAIRELFKYYLTYRTTGLRKLLKFRTQASFEVTSYFRKVIHVETNYCEARKVRIAEIDFYILYKCHCFYLNPCHLFCLQSLSRRDQGFNDYVGH